jgi:hypothetical protein
MAHVVEMPISNFLGGIESAPPIWGIYRKIDWGQNKALFTWVCEFFGEVIEKIKTLIACKRQ